MEFCQCGSLKVNGACSNKKCKNFVRTAPNASKKQLDIIKDMLYQLGREEEEYNLPELSSKDASILIEELEAELEAAE